MTEPERLEGVPGRYWHRLEDGRIQCDVCPRYCRLNEGQRGLCFVRGRQNDRIVLTTCTGRSSGLPIPGHNDSSEEVKKLSEWVMARLGPDVPLHFTAFHPDYKMLDLPRTPAFTLTTARDIARKVGLHFVYTGNVHDERGQSTYCPGCSERIIGRDWYGITTWRLTGDGRCGICSTAILGLFEAHPGN
jgi:hypothetical protein